MPKGKKYGNMPKAKSVGGDSGSKKVLGGQGKAVTGKVLKNHHTMRPTGNKQFPPK